MVGPIEGILSLSQVQTALEMLQTAQREAAIAQLKQERDTEIAKEVYQTTVTEREEARGKTIRDDDPRRGRPRRRRNDLPRPDDDEETPHVDIVV